MSFIVNRYQPKKYYSQNIYFYPQEISYGKYKAEKTIQVTMWTMDSTFCSCKGFYYNYNRRKCYHLSDVVNCIEKSNYTISIYEDEHYYQLVKRIILHIISNP